MTERDPRLVLQDAVVDAVMRPPWKALAFALLRYCSKDFRCWTSMTRLSAMSGITKGTLRDMLDRLVEAGGVSREARPTESGVQTSWLWTVHADRLVPAMVACDSVRARHSPPTRRALDTYQTTARPVPDDGSSGDRTSARHVTGRALDTSPDDGSSGDRTTARPRSGEMTRGAEPETRPGEGEPVSTRPRAHELVLVEAEVVELPAKRSRKQTPTVELTPLSTVWTLYRRWHPRAGKQPPKSWGIHHAIAAHGEEAVCALVEWAHESDHQRAQYLRDNDYLGATLFRPGKLPEYIAWAMEWVESGRASQMSEAEKKKRDPFGIHRAAYGGGGKQLTEDDFPF